MSDPTGFKSAPDHYHGGNHEVCDEIRQTMRERGVVLDRVLESDQEQKRGVVIGDLLYLGWCLGNGEKYVRREGKGLGDEARKLLVEAVTDLLVQNDGVHQQTGGRWAELHRRASDGIAVWHEGFVLRQGAEDEAKAAWYQQMAQSLISDAADPRAQRKERKVWEPTVEFARVMCVVDVTEQALIVDMGDGASADREEWIAMLPEPTEDNDDPNWVPRFSAVQDQVTKAWHVIDNQTGEITTAGFPEEYARRHADRLNRLATLGVAHADAWGALKVSSPKPPGRYQVAQEDPPLGPWAVVDLDTGERAHAGFSTREKAEAYCRGLYRAPTTMPPEPEPGFGDARDLYVWPAEIKVLRESASTGSGPTVYIAKDGRGVIVADSNIHTLASKLRASGWAVKAAPAKGETIKVTLPLREPTVTERTVTERIESVEAMLRESQHGDPTITVADRLAYIESCLTRDWFETCMTRLDTTASVVGGAQAALAELIDRMDRVDGVVRANNHNWETTGKRLADLEGLAAGHGAMISTMGGHVEKHGHALAGLDQRLRALENGPLAKLIEPIAVPPDQTLKVVRHRTERLDILLRAASVHLQSAEVVTKGDDGTRYTFKAFSRVLERLLKDIDDALADG